MAEKIKGNYRSIIIWLLLIGLLIYSRFINLGWGLPFPMHPDERNMAVALQELKCEFSIFNFQFSNLRECFNPHFFAYGQFPLYLGYSLVFLMKLFDGDLGTPIGFQEATISLRLVSALASLITVFVLLKIIFFISRNQSQFKTWFVLLVLIFSSYAIQFAHFGTTESLLMLFYSLIIFYSLKIFDSKILNTKYFILNTFFTGLALATKVSSIIFLAIPIIVIASEAKQSLSLRSLRRLRLLAMTFGKIFIYILFSLFIAFIFSPHNLLNWQEFLGSMEYERDVALGKTLVFYTRQFADTIPVWFQLTKVFPYALGIPMSLIGLIGFVGLTWKDKKINLLRLAFVVYFLPNAFLFAKWTRFMAPVFPIMTLFAILVLLTIKVNNLLKIIVVIFVVTPGIFYLSVYQKPDVRFQATEWINENIPPNSYVLSETANVIDIPLANKKNLNIISFNFYDLDGSLQLENELKEHLEKADYIFIPSRRIFANLNNEYPLSNRYYEKLFSGELGFKKVAEFSAGLNDEGAEETWTVFDHPVIRIYKRI